MASETVSSKKTMARKCVEERGKRGEREREGGGKEGGWKD